MDWEELSPRHKLKAAMEEGETMVIRPCFVSLSRTQEPPRLHDTSCSSDELSKAVVNKARKTLPIGNRKQLSILKNALVNHIASTKESIANYNCNGDVNNDLNHVDESLEDFSEDSPKRASSINMDAEDQQAIDNVCSEDRSALVHLEPNSLNIQILTVLSKVDPKEMVTENDSKVMVNGNMSEDSHTEDFKTDHVYCMHNEENVSQPNCAEEGSSENSGQLKHIATEHDYQDLESESHTMEPQDMDNQDVVPNNNSESLDSQVEAHATPEIPNTFTENDMPSIDKVGSAKLSKSSQLDEPDEDPNLNEMETVCQKNSELIQAENVEEENQEMAEGGPNTDHDQLDNGSNAILDKTSEELRNPCIQDVNDECGVNPMEETQDEETDNCSKSNGETIEEDRIPNLTQEYSGEISRKRTALEDDTEMEHMPKRSKVTTDVTTSVNEAAYNQQESPRLNGIINKTVEAAFQRQFGDIDGAMLMKQVRWIKSEVRKRDKDYEKFENLGSKLQSQLLCLEKMLSLAMQVVGKHLETPKNQEVSSEALVASQPQISMTTTAATTTTFASPSPPSSNPNSQQLKNKGFTVREMINNLRAVANRMQSKPGMPRSSPVSSVGSNLNGAPPGLASGTAAIGGSPQRARLAVPFPAQTVAGLLYREERARAATSSAIQMSSSAISGDERGRAIPPSDVPPALGGVPGGEERVRLVARPHFTAPRQATAALSSVGQMPPALPSVSVAPPPSSVARTPPVGAASQNHGSSNSHSTQSLALPSALSRVPSSNANTTCSPGTQLPHAGAGRPSGAMQSPVANRNPASRFSGTGTTGVSPNAQVRTSSVPTHTAPRAAVPVGTGSGSASRLPGHSASGQGLSSQIVLSQQQQQQQQASSRSPPSSGTAGTSSQALRRNSATSDAVIDLTEEDDDILITGMERGMRTVNRSQPGLSSTASQQRHLPGGPSSGSAQSKNMAPPSSRNTQVQQQQQQMQQQQQQMQQQQQQMQQHVSPQQLRGTQGQQNQGRVGQGQQIVPSQQQQQIRTSQVQSQQHRQHQPPQHQQQLSQLQQAQQQHHQQQQQHPSQHQSQHAPSRISPATQHGMALSRAPLSQANHDRVVVAQVHSQPAVAHQQQHGPGKAPLGAVSHTSICVPVSMSQQVVDGNIVVHGRQPLAHRQQQQQQQQQHLRPPPPLQRVVNSHVDTYGSMGPPPPYHHQQGGNGHMSLGPAGTHMGPMSGQMIHQGPPPTQQQQQLIHIPMQQIPPNVALAAVNFSNQMGMSSVPVYSSVGAMPVNGQPHYTQQQRLVVPSGLSTQMVNGLNGRVAQNMVRVSAPPSTHTQSPYQNSYITAPVRQSYPAPLPGTPPPPPGLPTEAAAKLPPQRPVLKLGRSDNQNAIVLQWNVAEENPKCAPVESYHLFAYHEDPNSPMPSQWKKIGEVKALPLPMACTLTQFVCRSKYYFAVRAKDVYGRYGPFCEPQCTDFKTP